MGSGGAGGGAVGAAHLSLITAITISGCSLLFLALLRSRLAQKEEEDGSSSPPTSPAPALASSGIKRNKKKQVVRFSEEVEDPRGNGAEYRTRLRQRRRCGGERTGKGPGHPAEDAHERRRKAANPAVPANRRALYRGLCQYRSQMATLMLYHT